ncbi:MAG TPA: hypothetical protein VK982_00735 [Bacteroidales bacterium]|nr:hypothetical protein [Bacteroidales bacterium]
MKKKLFFYGIQKNNNNDYCLKFGRIEGYTHNDALQLIIKRHYNDLCNGWYVHQLTTKEEANNL